MHPRRHSVKSSRLIVKYLLCTIRTLGTVADAVPNCRQVILMLPTCIRVILRRSSCSNSLSKMTLRDACPHFGVIVIAHPSKILTLFSTVSLAVTLIEYSMLQLQKLSKHCSVHSALCRGYKLAWLGFFFSSKSALPFRIVASQFFAGMLDSFPLSASGFCCAPSMNVGTL